MQLELLFKGVTRLDKAELKMLAAREEALDAQPRRSDFVSFVLPEDPAVCPPSLRLAAARRSRDIEIARGTNGAATPPSSGTNNDQVDFSKENAEIPADNNPVNTAE
jgi:hypothetical protein